jgi:hypothetical protein
MTAIISATAFANAVAPCRSTYRTNYVDLNYWTAALVSEPRARSGKLRQQAMNMAKIHFLSAIACAWAACSLAASGDEVRVFEQNGIVYRESRQVTPIGIAPPKLEPRQRTIYRERYTTELKEITRTVQTPVTQYQMTPVVERSLNPFATPYVAYRMLPTTHWVAQQQVVKIPVTRKEIVPDTITELVPVPRTSQSSQPTQPGEPSRPLNPVPTIAQRTNVGGVSKLESDPPRSGATNWRPAEATVIR